MARQLGRLALVLTVGVLGGCGQRNAYVPPPPPEVVVGVPEVRSVTIYNEYTGSTESSETVQLKARVQGYLDSIHFQDGTFVHQGDLLFVIDPRPYEAQLAQAQADLQGKKSTAIQLEAIYNRTLALLPARAATQEDVDVAKGNWLVAVAAIDQSRAKVQEAKLNLAYTRIVAPITGKIGRRLVDVGNLVSPDTTLLSTITRYDPMYVYFTVSETDYLEYLKRVRERPRGSLEETKPPPAWASASAAAGLPLTPGGWWVPAAAGMLLHPRYPVELGLADESGYPRRGYIDFANNTVDPNTGTLLLRALFSNPEPYYLAPGLFARLRVPIGERSQAVLIPEVALGTDQSGQFVLAVDAQNVVQQRQVKVGPRVGSMRVIEEGLEPGTRFIVEGLQKARPGGQVRPLSAH